jgi:dTDP-4-dehydrorhamnose 3,5-epimerase-like enzyme
MTEHDTTTATAIRTPAFVRQDDRGQLTEIINEGHWRAVLTGKMKRGAVMGNHYHKKTLVYFHLLTGHAVVRTVHVSTGRRDEVGLAAGTGITLKTFESHAICFLEPSTFLLLKSEPYNPDDADTYPHQVDGR